MGDTVKVRIEMLSTSKLALIFDSCLFNIKLLQFKLLTHCHADSLKMFYKILVVVECFILF